MSNKLYIMVGAPGSGKTTWIKNNLPNVVHISRDEIRFSKIKPGKQYFSKETQVYNEFIDQINKNIQKGKDVAADATHLNKASRTKLFRRLQLLPNTQVIAVYFNLPLQTCITQNEYRRGSRSYVPRRNLEEMYRTLTKPSWSEYNGIINKIIEIKQA